MHFLHQEIKTHCCVVSYFCHFNFASEKSSTIPKMMIAISGDCDDLLWIQSANNHKKAVIIVMLITAGFIFLILSCLQTLLYYFYSNHVFFWLSLCHHLRKCWCFRGVCDEWCGRNLNSFLLLSKTILSFSSIAKLLGIQFVILRNYWEKTVQPWYPSC